MESARTRLSSQHDGEEARNFKTALGPTQESRREKNDADIIAGDLNTSAFRGKSNRRSMAGQSSRVGPD